MKRGAALAALILIAGAGCGGGGGYAGLSPEKAKAKAYVAAARLPGGRKLRFNHLAKGRDNLTRPAWLAYYDGGPGFGSAYSGGCILYVRSDSVATNGHC